jgi:hypothetical protein
MDMTKLLHRCRATDAFAFAAVSFSSAIDRPSFDSPCCVFFFSQVHTQPLTPKTIIPATWEGIFLQAVRNQVNWAWKAPFAEHLP